MGWTAADLSSVSSRPLRLRWSGSCAACGQDLPRGTTALWSPEAKAATCLTCAGPTDLDGCCNSAADNTDVPAGEHPAAALPKIVDGGLAGASARREFERRSARERRQQERAVAEDAAWRNQIVESRPLLGRVATLITPKPVVGPPSQRARAWAEGAAGEELLGRHLATLPDTVRVLHDRRIPGSKANIDHIAVTPSGVFVIDAKNYDGRVEVRDVGPWHRVDDRLLVDGRNRTRLVDGVERQVVTVSAAAPDPIHVQGVLCFVGENWPQMFRRPLKVRAVHVVWPSWLVEHLQRPGALPPDQIRQVAEVLAVAFPPA